MRRQHRYPCGRRALTNQAPRPSDDLREEEHRHLCKLIQGMLTNGVAMPDDHTRHVVAELINSIFDIDKMLYFVAPEWWRPQQNKYSQQLGAGCSTRRRLESSEGYLEKRRKNMSTITEAKLESDRIGWGGINDADRDTRQLSNHGGLRTREVRKLIGLAAAARRRQHAKRVLERTVSESRNPIRPTKEMAAINWLKVVEGFNGIGDNDIYRTNNPNEKDINGLPSNGRI